ncbi:hypothetical protein B0H17DRAFT_1216919 [Mycena rosella]|uniref:Uncharacterized protein n=1 Tax=Mycena rosella TaxID=1033263 RepID=A0AAD7C3E8_MYCRO|nr:hypothetical protein B0H17DRAFT_1216919 [Mycena rosella]
MTNIRTVIWTVRPASAEFRSVIADFLRSNTLLDDLRLDVNGVTDLSFSLDELPNLRKLEIGSNYQISASVVRKLTPVILKNSNLSSLPLRGGQEEWSQLWTLLRTRQIYLTDVSATYVGDEILAYLGSYSGIERLQLLWVDAGSETTSNRFADVFFETVLPRHTNSIVQLSCPALYECRWSFGAHNAHVIGRLQRVSKLEMTVNCEDVPDEQSVVHSGENAVERILQLAAQLPALRNLGIFASDCEGNREAECGNPSMDHEETVSAGISAVVRDFRPCVSSPAIVVAGHEICEIQTAGTDPDFYLSTCRGADMSRYKLGCERSDASGNLQNCIAHD